MAPPRILFVDDEDSILESYRTVFEEKSGRQRLDELEKDLFSPQIPRLTAPVFETVYCHQGDEAVACVRNSLAENRPFSAVFLDVRMPPGPDGVTTAAEIRRYDPCINIVIVTAYSDISPTRISEQIQPPDKLLYIQKPFHIHEIRQFTMTLSAKWQLEQELLATNQSLEHKVQERTSELTLTIEALEASNKKFRETSMSLQNTEAELAKKALDLEGANQALQQMLKKDQKTQKETEERVLFAIHEMVEPYMDKLEQSPMDEYQKSFLKIIRTNLQEITAPFMKELSQKYFRLSPAELNVANLIKQGHSTKVIATKLEISKRNVDFYRDQIREKIGIKKTKANLKSVLKELDLDFSG